MEVHLSEQPGRRPRSSEGRSVRGIVLSVQHRGKGSAGEVLPGQQEARAGEGPAKADRRPNPGVREGFSGQSGWTNSVTDAAGH